MKKLCYFIAFLFLLSCKGSCLDDEFTIDQTNYSGDELRIDGYFYTGNGENTAVYILSQNGVIFFGCSGYTQEKFEELFRGKKFVESQKNNPLVWGLYKILNDTISYEYNVSYGGPGSYVYKVSGLIKNDTTIHEFIRMRSNGTEKEEVDCTYHFKHFSPKPDSTNNFFN
jgi:hypothetical protein